jgi:aminopeptidase-like protein
MLNQAFRHMQDVSQGVTPPIDMMGLLRSLFPLSRSLTGNGVRDTLNAIGAHLPVVVHEIPSGTKAFDWEVPKEWNIRGATIKTMGGKPLVDFDQSNLHVVGYSIPFNGVLSRDELAEHIHTLPDQPDVIPYRTSYYSETWGFCLPHSLWETMRDDSYQVEIDSELAPGHLTYGEFLVPGVTDREILISVHLCHPSLANDNLSGIVVAVALALHALQQSPAPLGLRFLFLPATIGAIAWLARNEDVLPRVTHGLVLTCIGDTGPFHYKKSRSPSKIDAIVAHALQHSLHQYEVIDFSPYGYDERQYGSPGINLPVGCLMRAVHGTFPEYHTSRDDCDFVTDAALTQSFRLLCSIFDICQNNRLFQRVDGRGEPQLGRRGLYRAIAGQREAGGASQMDLLWVLNLADGMHSLLDIAERARIPFARADAAAKLALQADLVKEVEPCP